MEELLDFPGVRREPKSPETAGSEEMKRLETSSEGMERSSEGLETSSEGMEMISEGLEETS